MDGLGTRSGWLRLALALAVAYLLAFQGIASAIARSVDPIASASASHFCSPEQQSPDQPKTEAHPCCLAGCRQSVDDGPAFALPSLIAWAQPGFATVVSLEPQTREPTSDVGARVRPPTRAPPLR